MLTIVPPGMSFWHVSNAPFTISDLKTENGKENGKVLNHSQGKLDKDM